MDGIKRSYEAFWEISATQTDSKRGKGPGEMEQRGKSGMVHPSDELGLEEKGI